MTAYLYATDCDEVDPLALVVFLVVFVVTFFATVLITSYVLDRWF